MRNRRQWSSHIEKRKRGGWKWRKKIKRGWECLIGSDLHSKGERNGFCWCVQCQTGGNHGKVWRHLLQYPGACPNTQPAATSDPKEIAHRPHLLSQKKMRRQVPLLVGCLLFSKNYFSHQIVVKMQFSAPKMPKRPRIHLKISESNASASFLINPEKSQRKRGRCLDKASA